MKVFYCYACERSFAATEPNCIYCQGDFVEEASASISMQLMPGLLAEQSVRNATASVDGTSEWTGSLGPAHFTVRTTVRTNTNNSATTPRVNSQQIDPQLITNNANPLINHAMDNPLLLVMDFLQAHIPGGAEESVLRPLFLALGIPGDPRDYVTDPERYREILDRIFSQQQPTATQGLSEEQIGRWVEERREPSGTCAICKEDYSAEVIVRKLPCGHIFHGDCVIPWLKRVASCPMCRKNPIP